MKSYNDTGDSFLMRGPNFEFLKDCVCQALKIDDKDSEQLSPFASQGKNIMHLVNFILFYFIIIFFD